MSKKFLHVGCGPATKLNLKGFDTDDWTEIRFDIDEAVNPDIVGTLTDMSAVKTGSIDAVFSSHSIEHIYPHEVIGALKEFNRVLTKNGYAVITCPDLQSVCEAVANDKLLEPLYQSPAGPISPIDILYGHRGYIASGKTYYAHRSGFTYRVLDEALAQAGFLGRAGLRRPQNFDLWIVAFKNQAPELEMRKIAQIFLP